MTDLWNRALRSAFDHARELEPTDAEVQRVLALDAQRDTRRDRRPSLKVAATACATLLLASGAYAVPPTRAALHDVYSAMTGWVTGADDQTAPGRPLEAGDDAPAWVRETGGEKRLVAQNGAAKLYAVRDDQTISFALGGSVGLSDTVDGWRSQLAGSAVVVLGPGAFADGPLDSLGRRPLFGVSSRPVARVELHYATGAPSVQDGLDGGFALLADARRDPRTLVAFDRTGRELDRVDLSGLDLRVCSDPRGCPPGRTAPPPSAG